MCALLAVFTILSAGVLHADTLFLKSGAVVRGTLEEVRGDMVYIRIPKGRIGYKRSEIAEMKFDEENTDFSELTDSIVGGAPREFSGADLSEEELARVRKHMSELIAQNDEPEDSGFNPARQELVNALAETGKGALPVLYEFYQQADEETAPYVLAALVRTDPVEGGAVAVQALRENPIDAVREMAVRVLGETPELHLDTLHAALADTQGHVRLAAIKALGNAGKKESLPELARILDSDLPHLQEAAGEALANCAGKRFASLSEAKAWAAYNIADR